jgi:hypothetical protein
MPGANDMTRRDLLKAAALTPVMGLGIGLTGHTDAAIDPPGKIENLPWPITIEGQISGSESFLLLVRKFDLYAHVRLNETRELVTDNVHWTMDNFARMPLGLSVELKAKDASHAPGVTVEFPLARHGNDVALETIDYFEEHAAELGGTIILTIGLEIVIRLNKVKSWSDELCRSNGKFAWYDHPVIRAENCERLV